VLCFYFLIFVCPFEFLTPPKDDARLFVVSCWMGGIATTSLLFTSYLSPKKKKMYDTYEPFRGIKMQSFTFLPKRYEIWQSGKMIKSGKSFLPINAIVVNEYGEEKVRITVNDNSLFDDISQETIFDAFISQKDRMQLITIPAKTNADCMGMLGNRMIVGATRNEKNFDYNDAYCCNLFMINGDMKKVTFAFSNPEKLIEFYQDGGNEKNTAAFVAKVITELLIADYDSDGSFVGKESTRTKVKEIHGFEASNEDFDNAYSIINSVFPQNNDIIQADYDRRAGSYFMSTYNKNSLMLVLREVNSMI
jgi:hypothetical protein